MAGKDIKHDEYTWVFEKADLEQGAYSICDPDLKKVVVLLPLDPKKQIDSTHNAWLQTRDFQSEEWKDRGAFDIKEAMTKGNEHVDKYRAKYQAAYTLKQMRDNLLRTYSKREKGNDFDRGR